MRQRRTAGCGLGGRVLAALALGAAALVAGLAVPAGAAADLRFCPVGSGAGQCKEQLGEEQRGVATDFETERVYVADTANNRIDVFAADGSFLFAFGWGVADGVAAASQTCTAVCFKGIAGSGEGQFKEPRRVAVDNDAASASHHDVYVFDNGNRRVEKFDPSGGLLAKKEGVGTGPGQFNSTEDLIAVSPSGKVYVGDTPNSTEPRIEVFDPALSLLEEFKLEREERLNIGLAIDAAGDVYAAFDNNIRIFKFKPDGSLFGGPFPLEPGTETRALALGEEGQLFAAQTEKRASNIAETFNTVTEYKPGGEYIERFGYGIGFGAGPGEVRTNGIALLHSNAGPRSGDVFASLSSSDPTAKLIAYVPQPKPGPVIAPLSVEVEALSTKAALAAELNPEGKKPTKYHFEYVDLHSFETEGGFASPNTRETAEVEVPIPAIEEEKQLFSLHATEKTQIGCAEPPAGECLVPETKYRFRVAASNPDGEGEFEGQFETKAGLEIKETWASEAGTTGARLNARVDPLGIPATGYFEYVDQASCEKDEEEAGPGHCFDHAKAIPDPAHPLAFGSGEASVRGVTLEGLSPGVSYRYRLIATDILRSAPLEGPVRALQPFATPAAPPCPNDRFRAGAGALLPDCRAYEMVSPLDKNNADIVTLGEFTTNAPAALDQSSVSGERVSYASSKAFGDAASAPFSSEYVAERGAVGWSSHSINSPLGEVVQPKVSPRINTEFKLFSPDLCQAWQRTIAEPPLAPEAISGYSNLYRRSDQSCGGAPGYEAITTVAPPHAIQQEYSALELQGTSADGQVAIYAAPDDLAAGAPPEPASCATEGKGCQLRLYEKRPGQAPVFLCILPGGAPVAPCQAGSGPGNGKNLAGNLHNAISADGELIYWSSAGKLYLRVGGTETLPVSAAGEGLSGTSASLFLAASADGAEAVFLTEKEGGNVSDLYEYEAEGETTTLIAHEAVGLAGMSEDGSRIYFASKEVLAAGAKAGRPNLYLDEEGTTRFIATLASVDPGARFSAVNLVPIQRMSRLSADGSALAFITTAAPTSYDNTDTSSPEECDAEDPEEHPEGVCDAELFLYEAQASEGEGKLVCVSCNPSGARSRGFDISNLIQGDTEIPLPAAAWIPAWENNLYATRVLSANGRRLFFEAADALSPLDTNGATDVYEWEQAGEGTCTPTSSGYAPSSGGCLDLISSGKSQRASRFLDADPSGRNAFFTTLSSLVPQDYGLIDVYDAREGGGFPPPPPPKSPCEGEACQSPPGPPAELTPASEAFGGEEAPEGKAKKKKGHRKHHRAKHRHVKRRAGR